MQIERYTRIVADHSDGRLKPVPRASMVRHPEIFYGVECDSEVEETTVENDDE
ncbi:hypothetical protein [Pseudohalioglobus sediminis]|nr:hypothetical protein [Pseudohalioglobus sediminis]